MGKHEAENGQGIPVQPVERDQDLEDRFSEYQQALGRVVLNEPGDVKGLERQ